MALGIVLGASDEGLEVVMPFLGADGPLEVQPGAEPRDDLLGVLKLEEAVVAVAQLLRALALA